MADTIVAIGSTARYRRSTIAMRLADTRSSAIVATDDHPINGIQSKYLDLTDTIAFGAGAGDIIVQQDMVVGERVAAVWRTRRGTRAGDRMTGHARENVGLLIHSSCLDKLNGRCKTFV